MLNPRRHILVSKAALLALGLALAGCASGSQKDRDTTGKGPDAKNEPGLLGKVFQSSKPITVPEGTVIPVTLDQAISSEDNHSGDEFAATVADPVVVEGKTVVPKGARAKGRVVDAKPSGRLHSAARLELALTSIEVEGKQYEIQTSDTKRAGKGHTKHNLIFIGGGTAAGAIIGGIAGGGKGAVIGGAVGAGAGTAGAAATGKKDIKLPPETRLSFPLSQPVTIQVKG